MAFKRGLLAAFVAVAEEGQITRAASRLQLGQASLSQAITRLEGEVGFQLFERHARGLRLTPAGATFLEKARLAVAADAEALRAARALVRSAAGTITFGYIGVPPALTNPDLIEAVAGAHPDLEFTWHALPFPFTPTGSWLGDVDVALASQPPADPNVWTLPLRAEPRVVLVPRTHQLADRSELTVGDVLEETFLGFAPAVDEAWAGFWSLDDYRGGPPRNLASERSATAQERFAMMAAGSGITTAPACHAAVITSALPGTVAIPLRDAEPTVLTLVGREDRRSQLVDALLAVARALVEDDSPAPTASPSAPEAEPGSEVHAAG
jgi:DNA-binding transcriptional LysR family regulator